MLPPTRISKLLTPNLANFATLAGTLYGDVIHDVRLRTRPSRSRQSPISSPEEDVLDWAQVAATFARRTLMLDSAHGLVVGVFGPWGSGKTSFINLARPEFCRAEVPVLDFNPWLFSGADQLVGRFFTELAAVMGEMSNLKQIGSYLQKYGDILSPAIHTMSALAGSPHAGNTLLALMRRFDKRTEPPPSAIATRNKLTKALAQRSKPIVVVLDDVDRLPIAEIRELFKLIRLTAHFPNLIYVVACDRSRVEAALEEDDPRLGSNYLEKIFQWSVHVPTAPRQRLQHELIRHTQDALGDIDPPFNHTDWPDIETEIIVPLVRNMRDVRRYSMAVRGAIDDLGAIVATIDVLALEAVRLFMPRFFDELPRLVADLTVLPTWERNQQHVDDIILEQMGGTEIPAEESRKRLENLIEHADHKHQAVARALIHRLFLGGRGKHDGQDPDWPYQQLKGNRVAHGSVFRAYFTRIADGDLTASNNAKRAFECLHDRNVLQELLRSHDPDTWTKTLLLLWGMFRGSFTREHVESGLVVFWNLLPDMPGPTSMSADEPLTVTQIVSKSLLVRLIGSDDIAGLTINILRQLNSYTAKIALVTHIARIEIQNGTLYSESDVQNLRDFLISDILSSDTGALALERHPAQVLLFSVQHTNARSICHIVHDSPKLTFALLWDCHRDNGLTYLGSRAVDSKRRIDFPTLISIYGDERTMETTISNLVKAFPEIESWVVSELGIEPSDARHLLNLAKDEVLNGALS